MQKVIHFTILKANGRETKEGTYPWLLSRHLGDRGRRMDREPEILSKADLYLSNNPPCLKNCPRCCFYKEKIINPGFFFPLQIAYMGWRWGLLAF